MRGHFDYCNVHKDPEEAGLYAWMWTRELDFTETFTYIREALECLNLDIHEDTPESLVPVIAHIDECIKFVEQRVRYELAKSLRRTYEYDHEIHAGGE